MGRTIRPSRLLAGLAAALIVVGGGAVAANADQLTVDGIAPIDHPGQAASVLVCAGQPTTASVLIAARRNGGANNAFKEGTDVTVSVDASSPLAATIADSTILVPAGWAGAPNNTLSTETITAVVAVPAQTAAGSGTVVFRYTGKDAGGATVSGTNDLSVVWTLKTQGCDSTAPTLALPQGIVAEATSAAGATVTFAATATDVAPANPSVSCLPSSGSVFPIGVTPVTCQATDTAGNTATGGFSVTVRDTKAPVVTPPADVTLEATGATTTATWPSATATDVVDGNLPATCTPASGSSFAVGTTTVTCSATDSHGNTGAAAFTVKITDGTAPALVLPSGLTAEATGPGGAAVTYAASASDLVDGSVSANCTPASGATFPLGVTTVNCSATDAAGNTASDSFTVKVQDTTAPDVSVPAPIVAEATGPTGAAVVFQASALDTVDGAIAPTCTPASGSTFALGVTKVTCSATDAAGNTDSADFSITVRDTTAPEISGVPATTLLIEATGPNGAALAVNGLAATDKVDGSVTVVCDPTVGATLAIGMHQVDCTAKDAAGNEAKASFAVKVQDTTAPAVQVPANITKEATEPGGASVTFAASATDAVDSELTVGCTPPGPMYPLGATLVTCSSTDDAGNTGSAQFTINVVDTTAPTIVWVGGPADGATYPFDYVPAQGTCTAVDLVDLAATCAVTGYGTAVGSHTLTATATDESDNTATDTRSYKVEAWKTGGFYAPVDGNGVWNTVKGGSTVPLKFELFAGSTELTSTSAVTSFKFGAVACGSSTAPTDEIEVTTTGGTSLRYDASGGQFIQNWQTPKAPAGSCYKVTMTAKDGSTVSALFKLK